MAAEIAIFLDDGTGIVFDEIVKNSLPADGIPVFCTKENALIGRDGKSTSEFALLPKLNYSMDKPCERTCEYRLKI